MSAEGCSDPQFHPAHCKCVGVSDFINPRIVVSEEVYQQLLDEMTEEEEALEINEGEADLLAKIAEARAHPERALPRPKRKQQESDEGRK